MGDSAVFVLLTLLALPFMALVADAAGWTRGRMIQAACGSAVISYYIVVEIMDRRRTPDYFAEALGWAFLVWPVALLVAKGFNPALSWRSIVASVPVMSWYLVNAAIQSSDPVKTSGLGEGIGFLLGWLYMGILFVPLWGAFAGGKGIVRWMRSGRAERRKVRIKLKV